MCPPLAVTTDEVGPRQAFDRWQDLISDTFVPLAVAPTTDRPFRGRVVHSSVGPVELTTVRACGQHVRRTAGLISGSTDEFVLASIQVAGCAEVHQSDRNAVLEPGDMVFYDSTRPYTLHFPDRFEQLVVQVPRRGLPDKMVERGAGVGLRVDGTSRLIVTFLLGLARQAVHDPDGASALAPHALGLLTTALALAAGAGPVHGPGESDRQRVLAHLTAHFADPDLNADGVARAYHLSRRSLYRLFEDQPEGFGETLRRLRLTAAQQLLHAEPRLPVAVVAARCGFGGPAQLHRVFRSATGATPAGYRKATS